MLNPAHIRAHREVQREEKENGEGKRDVDLCLVEVRRLRKPSLKW